jgi:hypothetical protein
VVQGHHSPNAEIQAIDSGAFEQLARKTDIEKRDAWEMVY